MVWCGVVWNRFVLLCDVMLCTGCKKYVNDVEDVKDIEKVYEMQCCMQCR